MAALTRGQKEYLNLLGKTATDTVLADGTRIVQDASVYSAELDAVGALDDFKSRIKEFVNSAADEKITEKYEREYNPKYMKKLFEAITYKAKNYSGSIDDFPYIKNEAIENGITYQQQADAVIAAAMSDSDKASKIETRRIKFNNAVDTASSMSEVFDLKQQAMTEIEAL